jgi:phenylalanyl-tRNA synthetase alpha chain
MSEIKLPELHEYSDASLETFFRDVKTVFSESLAVISGLSNRTPEDWESFRIAWTGRKQGVLTRIGELLKSAPSDRRRAVGIGFNALKKAIEEEIAFDENIGLSGTLPSTQPLIAGGYPKFYREMKNREIEKNRIDFSLPGTVRAPGIQHPLVKTMNEIVAVFHHLGYSTALGPQVESDFYNFEALNFPPNHPARDTQDTLVIAGQNDRPQRDRLLMRTHTSPVQIRTMIAQASPVRIVVPGKVHRNDAADATHSPVFHQVEGLCVDSNITFSDLKGTLDHAMKALFGSAVKTRFFPSFFPFTEPSADVQISCIFCAGKGCRKCKHSGWIELLGCGMVDPAVFASVTAERRKINPADDAYNPEWITGFAFGMGVERIAMIQHGISDIGHFYSGDLRFLEQFA